jgi:hypothetical protein
MVFDACRILVASSQLRRHWPPNLAIAAGVALDGEPSPGRTQMDQGYISAIAALAGTVIGGLTSFATTWLTQNVQARNARMAADRTK